MFQAAIAPSTSSAAPASISDAELVSFLVGVLGESIQLTTIGAKGFPVARHFGKDALGAARWARRENEQGGNVYFSVNRVRAGLHKKASKADIESIRFAHVDIDPPKDGSPWDRDAVAEKLFEAAARPDVVLVSGNGLQAFWRVAPGASIDEIEALNKGITDTFGGDAGIWNADRIMRVPGTINWPNERQRAIGRVPSQAYCLWATDDGASSVAMLREAFCKRGARK